MNLLVAFDLLMQEQNVSRAAERMFVSQSAMSHILQRLRQQLDDPLLVKTPSGMMPTDRALALIDPVAVVLRDVRRLINAREEFDPATSVRRFVIAATDYMDLLVIPALVERIVRYAPGVDFHVKQTETPFPVRELEYNDLDVVLGFETILKPPGHLVVEKLFDDRMTCLVSRNHPANKAELLTLDEYVSMKHMLISRSGTRIGLIDDWLAEKGLERRIALIVPHFLSAPFIVAKTDMLLSLPERIAEKFVGLAPLSVLLAA
jgi:DNA-binding transcriptional LysR family regulator